MHPSLEKIFTEIELQRRKILDSTGSLPDEVLNESGAPGKWSIAQILSHLVTAERLSLMYVQKKMLGVEQAGDTGLWEELKMYVLKISQRLPGLRFRAPRAVIEKTPAYGNIALITREWDLVRSEFKILLENIPERYVKRRIYRHIRAGYLNIKHCLLFFREHIIHHTPQINKLLKNK